MQPVRITRFWRPILATSSHHALSPQPHQPVKSKVISEPSNGRALTKGCRFFRICSKIALLLHSGIHATLCLQSQTEWLKLWCSSMWKLSSL